jgi:hypothetical protein
MSEADYCKDCKYWDKDPKDCPHTCCYHHSQYLTAYMQNFVLITKTHTAGRGKLRWECTHCRKNPDQPECRFNLDASKINIPWKCRFCKKESMLRLK